MTKNSNKPIFRDCLLSIKKSDIPINNLIVIDGGSTDGTIALLHEIFEDSLIIHFDSGNLASSRTKAIELVETEWFAFIDSDVIIPKNWYSEICKYKPYGTGLESWNWNWTGDITFGFKTKRNILYAPSPRHQEDRARTIADLIETKYVKGINIPKDLFILEDDYLRYYMKKKGGTWIKTGVKVDHYPREWNVKPFTDGYLRGKYDFCSHRSMVIKAFGNLIFRKKKSRYYFERWFGYLWGLLHRQSNGG
jgi:glycosyltransferase involved in cell wall biosynthesis